VGKALEMPVENAKVDCLLDQLNGLFDKVFLIAHDRKDHTNCKGARECKMCRKINGYDVLQCKYGVVYCLEHDFHLTYANVRAHKIGVPIEPLAFPLALTIK